MPHCRLSYSFLTGELQGKVITRTVIRNMYSKLTACTQLYDWKFSELFSCSAGTQQGCTLSPFMFILYLTKLLSIYVKSVFIYRYYSVNMLLYATDIL